MSTSKYTVADLLSLRYSTNSKSDTIFEWEGSIFAFIPGQQPKKIFKCVGMNISKAKIEEGKLKVTGKELTYYLDPVTGEKLTKWDNPWTGEKDLPVIHIANDPVQMSLPTAIPLEVRHNKFSETSTVISEIPLFYTNPLYTEDHKFDKFDSNKMYEAGEFFTFKCNTKELEQSTLSNTTMDAVEVNWSRVSKFCPFMKMGKQSGYLLYHCTGFKLPQGSTVNDLTHSLLVNEIRKDMKSYAYAPHDYDTNIKSVSSWTYFRDHFDRYQNDPNAIWPIPSLN
ncbi:uncharacterized protein BX663DRAFT_547087 [Cokeromyces recurvatus]|uniref:uncharacterized protein n=1 Tax=Cokeromyces recurvatus TaxID=90255 RepID=UPI00221EE59F|nr:uncharacterized protein BX663DRAFT_547087 [Cokeromyces recurvatus]KAI7897578.1 hypothetical protein BX663DRAFT_547087 [Cokeromyces recurvatus]